MTFSTDDFLASLRARRLEALALEASAKERGDLKEARSFATGARKMEKMIYAKGGVI